MCANSIRREVHDLLLRVAEKVAEGCEDELRSLLWLELLAYKREALRELEAHAPRPHCSTHECTRLFHAKMFTSLLNM